MFKKGQGSLSDYGRKRSEVAGKGNFAYDSDIVFSIVCVRAVSRLITVVHVFLDILLLHIWAY